MRPAPILAPLLLAAALAGCSGDSEAQVADVASRFYAAVADADGAAACRLLAPGTLEELEASSGEPCADAVLAEVDGSRADPAVEVSGAAARVAIGTDTAFLAEYAEGWRIVAAGCTEPVAEDRPHECTVKGG